MILFINNNFIVVHKKEFKQDKVKSQLITYTMHLLFRCGLIVGE